MQPLVKDSWSFSVKGVKFRSALDFPSFAIWILRNVTEVFTGVSKQRMKSSSCDLLKVKGQSRSEIQKETTWNRITELTL